MTMIKTRARSAPKLLILCLSLMLTETTRAQIPEDSVTAQRAPSLESKTPVARTTLSAAELTEAGIANPGAIGARRPSMQQDNATDGLRITIRGVSNADTTEKGDPSAAFLLDGI